MDFSPSFPLDVSCGNIVTGLGRLRTTLHRNCTRHSLPAGGTPHVQIKALGQSARLPLLIILSRSYEGRETCASFQSDPPIPDRVSAHSDAKPVPSYGKTTCVLVDRGFLLESLSCQAAGSIKPLAFCAQCRHLQRTEFLIHLVSSSTTKIQRHSDYFHPLPSALQRCSAIILPVSVSPWNPTSPPSPWTTMTSSRLRRRSRWPKPTSSFPTRQTRRVA